MHKETLRPAWIEVNLSNLAYNIASVKKKIGSDKEILGIIKADGYGHGAYEVSQVLKENGINTFGVATIQEAITLREKGVNEDIVLVALTPDIYVDSIVKYDIMPVTCSYQNALAISEEAKNAGKIVQGFIALDTGMGRIGLRADDAGSIDQVKKIASLANFKIKGLFSHFATSGDADTSYAEEQMRRYAEFDEKLKEVGIEIDFRTLANSGAIMQLPSALYSAVRPGILLYGCYPSDEIDQSGILIKPVMSVKASIVQLKKIQPGTSIGYGRKFIAKRESLIATIHIGYADGLPRRYSSLAKVIVGGVVVPLAGAICMDQCMIDVTDVPNVKQGDEVIIMGSDGKNTISAEDIACATDTINYEIVCAFGLRLPRVYLK